MSDPISEFQLLMALHIVSALVWIGAALSAWVGYRAFKQSTDLRWAVAFLILAGTFLGEAYVAYRWTESLPGVAPAMRSAAGLASFYHLRLAGFELVAAFLIFYLFRQRRKSY